MSQMLEDAWQDALEATEGFADARQKALEAFQKTTFADAWKTTRTQSLFAPLPTGHGTVSLDAIQPFLFDGEAARVVFVDGAFSPDLSTLTPELTPAITECDPQDPIGQLAFALCTAGATIDVPAGDVGPLHIIHVQASGTMRHLHHTIRVGQNARATIVESYVHVADEPGWTNVSVTLEAAAGAHVHHFKIQKEDKTARHSASMSIRQARDSHVHSIGLHIGGAESRQDIRAHLEEEGAHVDLRGVFFGSDKQRNDIWTHVDHAVPHCSSNETFKGILDGASYGAFTGNILVRRGADGTSSEQENRNLLLSDKAKVDTTPQLEIYADDVRCAHGSTIGQLDDDAIFFLRARGISEANARLMLTRAFAADVIHDVEHAGIRALLERHLHVWFVKHHEHLA